MMLASFDSDTYHAWSLIGAYNYWLHSGDTEWLEGKWEQYLAGVSFLADKVDADVGLINATGDLDWGRLGGGGFSISPNVLYYRVCSLLVDRDDLKLYAFVGPHQRRSTLLRPRRHRDRRDLARRRRDPQGHRQRSPLG